MIQDFQPDKQGEIPKPLRKKSSRPPLRRSPDATKPRSLKSTEFPRAFGGCLYIYIYAYSFTYLYIPAPSKGCQINAKKDGKLAAFRNYLALFGRCWYIARLWF